MEDISEDRSIDFSAMDLMPFKGFSDYLARNKRYFDPSMSDYQKGCRIEVTVKSAILFTYNLSIITGASLGLIYGLEKTLG